MENEINKLGLVHFTRQTEGPHAQIIPKFEDIILSEHPNFSFFSMTYLYLVILVFSFAALADDLALPSWVPTDSRRIDESASERLLKDLNAKWDGDLSEIVSFDVTYHRCAIDYTNLKDFDPKEAMVFVEKITQEQRHGLFDQFFDTFVKKNQKKTPENTRAFEDMVVSKNRFLHDGKRRMEVFTRPGFSMQNKQYPEFSETYLIGDGVYICANQFNHDVRIDLPSNNHADIAYLMDFIRQPLDRFVWEKPPVYRADSLPSVIYINSGGCTSQIDLSRGLLLKQEIVHANSIGQQLFPVNFFLAYKNLWLPRTVLSIKYFPYDALIQVDPKAKNLLPNKLGGSVPYLLTLIEIEDVKINKNVSKSSFNVPAVSGSVIRDYREDVNNPFTIQADHDVQDVLAWISAKKALHNVPEKTNRLPFIIIVNLFFVACIAYLIIRRNKIKNR